MMDAGATIAERLRKTARYLESQLAPLNARNCTEAADEIERLIAVQEELLGCLRFILAFYEPGQRYLDTNAWKHAEAGAREAVAKVEKTMNQ